MEPAPVAFNLDFYDAFSFSPKDCVKNTTVVVQQL